MRMARASSSLSPCGHSEDVEFDPRGPPMERILALLKLPAEMRDVALLFKEKGFYWRDVGIIKLCMILKGNM
jgi:hypothetical protein